MGNASLAVDVGGGLMATFGSYMAAHTVFYMDEHFLPGLIASFAVFALWGVGVNVASVSYLSLASELTERSPKTWRTATVGVMWTAMILSTIIASISLSRLLAFDSSQDGIYFAFGAIWVVATVFILLGSARVEPANSENRTLQNKADNPNDGAARSSSRSWAGWGWCVCLANAPMRHRLPSHR
jgi:BCD family chlorophyll transporter-like MFS transporter